MNSRKKYIKRVCVSVLILLVITMVIYLLINTGTSKIEVGKVYRAYAYDYDNRLTSGYIFFELVDEDSFVVFSDTDIEPNPQEAFDDLYDYSDFNSIRIRVGKYQTVDTTYYCECENRAYSLFYSLEEWENRAPQVFKENYDERISDYKYRVEKGLNGYYLIEDHLGLEAKYLLKEDNNKTIPQSIDEFKQEYAKNY